MMKGRKLGRHAVDWMGLNTAIGVKVTDQELISLNRAVRASGKTRSELLRAAIATVVAQAALAQGGGSQ